MPEALEVIKANMRSPYRPENHDGRQATLDSLMRTRALGTGPAIRPSQLAALVVQKLGNRKCKTKGSAAVVWAEIESTLDLIEMCQWALHFRQTTWRQRAAIVCGVGELEKRKGHQCGITQPSGELKQLWQNVTRAKYPLSFSRGLQAMGNRTYPVEQRATRFFRFLLAGLKKWDWAEAPDGIRTLFSGLPDVPAPRMLRSVAPHASDSALDGMCNWHWEIFPEYQLTESDIRAWIENREFIWPDEETLWWVTQKWFEWQHTEEEKANRKRAGLASAAAKQKNKR